MTKSPDYAYPFDVKFTITGDSTVYGYMLSTPEGQTKQISFAEPQGVDASRLQTQQIAVDRDFDPRFDTPFAMSNLTGGCGQRFFDFNDENKYWWSSGVVTHVNGQVYPAPPTSTLALSGVTGAITGILTYYSSGTRYDFLWEGLNIWRRDATNSTNAWTKVYTASVTITNFYIFNGIGLIAIPTASGTSDYSYQTNVLAAATWAPTTVNHTPFDTTAGKPAFFYGVRGTVYALVNNNKVYYNVDPTADSWIGPINTTLDNQIAGPPGDTTYAFKGAIAIGDFLFVLKNDCIYSIDSSQDVIEIIWQWKDKPADENFKYFGNFGDALGFSVANEVYSYDPVTGVTSKLGYSMNDGFSVNSIVGVSSDNQYIYTLANVRVPVLRSANSMALFRTIKNPGNRYTHEVLWEDTSLSGKDYKYLKAVPSGTGTRLYWGVDDSGDTDTYLMDIPANWDETTNASYTTTGTIWTSITYGGFPNLYKKHLYFNMDTLNLNSTNKVQALYTVDDGSTYTSIVTATSTPSETALSNIKSKAFGLKFVFTSDGTVCPILKTFDHHQRVRFKYLPTAQLKIRVADEIRLRNNAVIKKNVADLWLELTTLRSTNTEILYEDFLGNQYVVSVEQLVMQPTENRAVGIYEEEAGLVITRADRGL